MSKRKDQIPVWSLPEDQIISMIGPIRAGEDLTPEEWPNGGRVAVLFSVDVDNDTAYLEDGLFISVLQSNLEYGSRRGLSRLVNMFDAHDIPVTFFIPAMSLKIAPHMANEIKRSGNHEVGLHGWVHESAALLSKEEHRMLLTKSIDYLESVFGERPGGYRTPWGSAPDPLAPHTFPLLKELNILYDSSLLSDDRPYELHVEGKAFGMIEIPPSVNMQDTLMATISIDSTDVSHTHQGVLEMFKDEFDVAYKEGTILEVVLHPHIAGQRAQTAVLEKFIKYMKSMENVWFATHLQVAEYVKPGLTGR